MTAWGRAPDGIGWHRMAWHVLAILQGITPHGMAWHGMACAWHEQQKQWHASWQECRCRSMQHGMAWHPHEVGMARHASHVASHSSAMTATACCTWLSKQKQSRTGVWQRHGMANQHTRCDMAWHAAASGPYSTGPSSSPPAAPAADASDSSATTLTSGSGSSSSRSSGKSPTNG